MAAPALVPGHQVRAEASHSPRRPSSLDLRHVSPRTAATTTRSTTPRRAQAADASPCASPIDSISIRPRALARFDNNYTDPTPSAFTADPTAVVLSPTDIPTLTATTSPANNTSLPQGTNLVVTYNATAKDGVGFVRLPFSAAASET